MCPPSHHLRPAKRRVHPLPRERRVTISREFRLIVERFGEHRNKFMKRAEVIPFRRCTNDRFDAVIERNVRWVDCAHGEMDFAMPVGDPCIESLALDEQSGVTSLLCNMTFASREA